MHDRRGQQIHVGSEVAVHFGVATRMDKPGVVIRWDDTFVYIRGPWPTYDGGMLPENITVTDEFDIGL